MHHRERIVLRDLATSKERTVFEVKGERLARSGDGSRAAVMKGSKVLVFDVLSGEVLFECRGRDPVLDARGVRLLVTDSGITLHDLEAKTKNVLEGGLWTPLFLADGRLAQRESLKPVRVWGAKTLELPTSGDHAWSACSTADGSRIAVIQPSATQLFDGHTGKVASRHPGGWAGLFAPDGTLFIASNERLFRAS